MKASNYNVFIEMKEITKGPVKKNGVVRLNTEQQPGKVAVIINLGCSVPEGKFKEGDTVLYSGPYFPMFSVQEEGSSELLTRGVISYTDIIGILEEGEAELLQWMDITPIK